jgi:hypothetical protein
MLALWARMFLFVLVERKELYRIERGLLFLSLCGQFQMPLVR